MQSFCVLAFILLTAGQYAYAATPSNAAAGGCVFLNSTIYCYGGYSRNNNNNNSSSGSSSFVYELDLSNQFRIQSNNIYTQWNAVTVEGTTRPSVSTNFAIAGIPAYRRFVIDGGASASGSIPAKNQSVFAFQTDKQTWSLVPNMTALTVQSHTMVLGNSSANLVYLWGGYGRRSGQQTYWSATRILDLNTNAWTYRSSLPSNFGIRLYHSAVLAKDNITIYYIGGRLATLITNTTDVSSTALSSNYTLRDPGMSSIYAYNTVMDSWTNLTVGGSTAPSSRVLHSTVLLADGNILLYGGSHLNNMTVPVDDYFYLLNTTNTNSLRWTTFDIGTREARGAGPRYGHSAIRVSNDTVFILFGGTTSAPATNEVHILNVSNWAWTRSFSGLSPHPSSPGSPQPSPTPSSPTGDGGGLSGGGIAGIVVGVIGAIVILGAILFFMKRKRRAASTYDASSKEREAISVSYGYPNSHRSADENVFFGRLPLPQEYHHPPPAAPDQDGSSHPIHRAAVLSPSSSHGQDVSQPSPPTPRFHDMVYTPQLALRPISPPPPPPQSEKNKNNDDD